MSCMFAYDKIGGWSIKEQTLVLAVELAALQYKQPLVCGDKGKKSSVFYQLQIAAWGRAFHSVKMVFCSFSNQSLSCSC